MADKPASELIDRYYERPQPKPDFVPGQICTTEIFFLEPLLTVLHFDYDAANSGKPLVFQVGPPKPDSFDHDPVKQPIALEQHEAGIIVRAKVRPCVILSTPMMIPNHKILAKNFPEAFLVVPMFSYQDWQPPEYRRRVEAFEYNMLFHLPADGDCEIDEGCLRLDRIQAAPLGRLKLCKCRLTTDALDVLLDVLDWYLIGELDSMVAEHRAIMLGALGRRP